MQIRGATRLVLVPQPDSHQKIQAAQWFRARLVILRLRVQIPPGAGLFSSLLYPISGVSLIRSLIEVQHYLFFH